MLIECLDKIIFNLIKDRNEKILNNLVLFLKEICYRKETYSENREKFLDSVKFFDMVLSNYFSDEYDDFQAIFYSLIVYYFMNY